MPLTKNKNVKLKIFDQQDLHLKILKNYSKHCSKILCQVDTLLGVLYLVLIVYYMSNVSREELLIIFHRNPINTLRRYV